MIAGTAGSGGPATTAGGSGGSGQVVSVLSVTRWPDRTAVPTAARSLPGSTTKPRSAPNPSRATAPAASVAVVITGSAPSTAATRRARSLAPPAWAPVTGTAKRRASSTQTTPGSWCLSRRSGASRRTVAPTARNTTTASASPNAAGRAVAAGPS